ncbi:MAG: 5-guanidino-2-oxopentanoate decarboxylase [Cellvibrionaceae bacterium]|nr:5-guanidino-2-oxopentanoate decarboxylase [Cellvibrionaceae bacterium]
MTSLSCGEAIPLMLKSYAVDTVFGIPGVHSLELYRGLPDSGLRHVTPRHEQGAGFMADGYARACGKPGVCFIITGPGMTNIATAMGQAMQDSIPMLVISSVNSREHLAMGEGRLHELPDQLALTSKVSVYSHRLMDVANLPKVLARAFGLFASQRPGPVHIEIPLDVLVQDASAIDLSAWPLPYPCAPNPQSILRAAEILKRSKRPLMIIGGGAKNASAALIKLAGQLDAPVVNTANAKGLVPLSHSLAIGGSPSCPCVRKEIEELADVVLAIGTEFSETDYDFFFLGDLKINGTLIRVDIDANQLSRAVKPGLAIVADAKEAVLALLNQLPQDASVSKKSAGKQRAALLREQLEAERNKDYHAFFETIKSIASNALIVGDSSQPNYHAQVYYETEKPSRYFHSATGYGTLGYAIPAALGAKLAQPDLPVICICGDGGGQFTLNEISSAVEAQEPVIFLIWNNQGYGEIRRFMEDKQVPKIGVDIYTPDYLAIAKAMGCESYRAASLGEFSVCLQQALENRGPSLILVQESGLVSGTPF